MEIKEILVHLDSTTRSAVRFEVAARLAVRFRAYLVGLNVIHGLEDISGYKNGTIPVMEDEFQERLTLLGIKGEWRLERGPSVNALTKHGRCTDLIVIGQHNPVQRRGGLSEKEFFRAVDHIGRPVLAVPYIGSFANVGERILVAWDGSPESTRAINEAIPLLSGAKAVTIVVSNLNWQACIGQSGVGAGILLHLSRHGIAAKAEQLFIEKRVDEGERLLSFAAESDTDLIISGALAHSSIREWAFKSFACTVIKKMTVPLFLSN